VHSSYKPDLCRVLKVLATALTDFPCLMSSRASSLLITAKLTRTAEGDPAFAGADETVLSALSMRARSNSAKPAKTVHTCGRTGVSVSAPWLVKRL